MRTARFTYRSMIVLSALAAASSASAQTYPDRAVKVIVPYAAGGNTDAISRLISAKLSEALNQQFVVENRSGASGAIAMEAVKSATPDGYTLLTYPLPQAAILPAMTKVKYNPITDFAPTLCAALRITEPAGSHGKPFAKALAEEGQAR